MNRHEPRTSSAAVVSPPANGAVADGLVIDDCWNRIGVVGDASCAELEKVVHCRNCPVYSRAGVQLLNRPLPADYRREWTGHFARARHARPFAKNSAVVFRIGREWFALPTRVFQEVADQRAVHSIPHRRKGIVLGLMNVRGELLLCVSVGRLFGLEQAASPAPPWAVDARLLVANWDGQRLVFPVDEVHGLHRFHPDEVSAPPATLSNAPLTFTEGVLSCHGRTVGFLNADLLFAALNRNLS